MAVIPNDNNRYQQDGEDARTIAKHIPYFLFKGIPCFYDIGGFLAKPEAVPTNWN
jgi:hypothetical protein